MAQSEGKLHQGRGGRGTARCQARSRAAVDSARGLRERALGECAHAQVAILPFFFSLFSLLSLLLCARRRKSATIVQLGWG